MAEKGGRRKPRRTAAKTSRVAKKIPPPPARRAVGLQGTAERSHDSVGELLAQRRLERVRADPAFVGARLEQAQRYLSSASRDIDAGDFEPAFTSAYDAARFAIDAHMQANGLRASNAPGAHRATVDYLVSEMSTLVPEDGVALFEAMRDVRHQIEYPSAGVASVRRTDVDRALALAGKLHGSVRGWWKEKQQAAP